MVSSNASYTFTANKNRTLVAVFAEKDTPPTSYTIAVSANPTEGGTVSGGGTYQQDQSVTVTATAKTGYTFVNWTENGTVVSSNASYTFAANKNHTLLANFVKEDNTNKVASVSYNGSTPVLYETLDEAIASLSQATKADKATLQLLANLDLGSNITEIVGGTFTLDLNGKTLSSRGKIFVLQGSADVTMMDSSAKQTGTLKTSYNGSLLTLKDTSSLTVNSGTLATTGQQLLEVNGKSVTIHGGTLKTSGVHIIHYTGTVSFVGHSDPSGIVVQPKKSSINRAGDTLSKGYGFYGVDDKPADTLAVGKSYTIKGEQNAPFAPELSSKTYNRVTLKTLKPNANGAVAQYSRDGGKTWQNSPVFTGLSAKTKYSFVARYQGISKSDHATLDRNWYAPSPASHVLEVTTDAVSSGGGSSSGGGAGGGSSSGGGVSGGSSSGGGGGFTGAYTSVTIPISGTDNTIHVSGILNGNQATISAVNLSHLHNVIGSHVKTGTVTIDFSKLNHGNSPITTVEIPSNIIREIAAAVKSLDNDVHGLEILISDNISIEFDAEALEEKADQATGLDITISIRPSNGTGAQTSVVKNRPAYDVNITSGGRHITDMGGMITVSVPYTLKHGETGRGIKVWYVDENGKLESCATSYDAKKRRVSWNTDHLSLYMIGYDETQIDNPFTDVGKDTYYFPAVLWALDRGITTGVAATIFGPDASCTRAEMATFLWRAAGSPQPVNSTHPFTDVDGTAYYAKAVQWAQEQGITNGTTATLFTPDAPCTRVQMATFLWRAAGSPQPVNSTHPFTDVDGTAYYAKAVQWAYEQNITSGTTATLFSPDAPCTRAQMVTFLYRHP